MKTKIYLILLVWACTANVSVCAQEACKVLKPEISGSYLGDCKKGLANGKGIARGTDSYEGKFKEGLPNGYGVYRFANGDIYEGEFRAGLKDGKGKFSFRINGRDSVFQGIWEGDKFAKKIVPPPFQVTQKLNIQRFNIQKTGNGNRVMFDFIQNGMINNSLTNLAFAESSGTAISVGQQHGFDSVHFPFNCKVTYWCPNALHTSSYEVAFEFQITEPGQWSVTVYN
ncbi:MAG TPA: hypothetical protein PLG33_06070 [Prolixibacteraceae bacterium]|nr:hypothetical protein [Prolixibacteraceae bacterium]HPR85596.1 hypothetical protein [Prolixibacteraceae bacterium]